MKLEYCTEFCSNYAEIPRRNISGLEGAFFEEMAKHIMPQGGGAFSGGAGEDQFSSFLKESYGRALAERIDLKIRVTHG
ncbi:MAG: hypothetical protein Q4G25_09615 [Paracoccus sp. (in: a-proteobacteria)]|nr:hypothetical protein [Paracoccus sp. (in: a-proteobacteria)]